MADIFVMTKIFKKKIQKFDFLVIFEIFLNFSFDFVYLDIVLNAYTKFQGQTQI